MQNQGTPGPFRVVASDGKLDGAAKFESGARVLVMSAECDIHPVADFSCNHTCREIDEQEANAQFFTAAATAHPKLKAERDNLYGYVNGLLGLLQMIGHREDMPADIKNTLRANHRAADAAAYLTQIAPPEAA